MLPLWGLYQALDVRRRKGHPKPGEKRHLVKLLGWYEPMVRLGTAWVYESDVA